jgi:hypothetical protein
MPNTRPTPKNHRIRDDTPLVGFFPEQDYDLYGSNELDRYPKPFVGERRELAGDRFFLTAIARDPPA